MSMQNKLLHTHSKLYFGSKIVQKIKIQTHSERNLPAKEYQKVRKGPKENAFYYFSVCLYRNFINFANYEEQSVHPYAFIVNQS